MLRSSSSPFPFVVLLVLLFATTGQSVALVAPASAAPARLTVAHPNAADEKKLSPDKSDKQPPSKLPKTISSEDQTATLDFIREHHPELSHLLEQLQKSRPDEFRSALRELVPQTQAIIRMRDRLPSRYPTQLAAWKRDSQIRLLMARWSRTQDPQIEAQVRELIAQRHRDRTTELQSEQQRLSEQLRKVEEQLRAQTQDPQQSSDAEWEQLARRATAAARSAKAAAPPKKKILSRPSKIPKPATPETDPADPPSAK